MYFRCFYQPMPKVRASETWTPVICLPFVCQGFCHSYGAVTQRVGLGVAEVGSRRLEIFLVSMAQHGEGNNNVTHISETTRREEFSDPQNKEY